MEDPDFGLEELQEAILDMVNDGLVEDSGERRPGSDGKPHIVWKLTELGKQVADKQTGENR